MASRDQEDDVAQATYTARTYPLATGEPADLHEARIGAALASVNLPVSSGTPHRDTSLEGAGTAGAGAGYVDPKELEAQMEHPRDPEVDNATYVSRSQYLGISADRDPSSEPTQSALGVPNPSVRPSISHTETSPHIPGEFPTETGEDDPVSSVGTAAGIASAGGAAGALQSATGNTDKDTVLSAAHGSSSAVSGAPAVGNVENSAQSPILTTTNTIRNGSFSSPDQGQPAQGVAATQSQSHGRDAVVAAGAAAAAGGAYELGKDHHQGPAADVPQQTTGPVSVTQGIPAVTDPIPTATDAKGATTSNVRDPNPSHLGRDTAIAGGTGAAGAAAVAAYENTAERSGPTNTSVAGASSTPAIEPQQVVTKTADSGSLTQTDAPRASTTDTREPFARDPAVAAGAGAALGGVGAYEMSKDTKEPPIVSSAPTTLPPASQTQPITTTAPIASQTPGQAAHSADAPSQDVEHHYGRDAALAGGATAAGVGTYELAKDANESHGAIAGSQKLQGSDVAHSTAYPTSPLASAKETQAGTGGTVEPHNLSHDAAVSSGAATAGAEASHLEKERANEKQLAASAPPPQSQTLAQDTTRSRELKDHQASAAQLDENTRRSLDRPESNRQSLDEHGNNKVSVDEHGHRKLHKKRVEQVDDKHDQDLDEARDREYEVGGDRGEVKHGILHKILHPREHKREKQEAEEHRQRVSLEHSRSEASQDAASPQALNHPLIDESKLESLEQHARRSHDESAVRGDDPPVSAA